MTVSLLEGHVVDVLASQPANHWHVCVTSPPYLWLRSYSTEPQVWQTADGDALCAPEQHEWHPAGTSGTRLRNGQGTTTPGFLGGKGDPLLLNPPTGAFCVHCHAWRGELGQEPTIELYVEHLVAVFRAVRRVLRPDGTLWVNLAGCYYNDPGGQNGASTRDGGHRGISEKAVEANIQNGRQKRGRHPWLKPLDWVDVPGLFAQAMQRDGWLWRSDVVWVKPSALPESVSGTRFERCRVRVSLAERSEQPAKVAGGGVRPQSGVLNGDAPGAEWADCPGCLRCEKTDGLVLRRGSGRPTKATERVLLFVKGPGYWFDQEAVRETNSERTLEQAAYEFRALAARGDYPAERRSGGSAGARVKAGEQPKGWGYGTTAASFNPAGRNLRDWWVIGPSPLKDEHYAAYPPELPSRCIRAGTSEWGCCPSCGAPWARVINQKTLERYELPPEHEHYRPRRYTSHGEVDPTAGGGQRLSESSTLGWRPTCRCPGVADQPPIPARVLDIFGGSGTTALAANRLGRDCTLVELKPQYAELARKRVGREPLSLFAWKPADTTEEVEV